MSVIGPRPTLRYQVEQYDEDQRRRLDVRPGLTGWAQVHGRASLPWAERIELDVWYVEHRSPASTSRSSADPARSLPRTYRGATGGWREALELPFAASSERYRRSDVVDEALDRRSALAHTRAPHHRAAPAARIECELARRCGCLGLTRARRETR